MFLLFQHLCSDFAAWMGCCAVLCVVPPAVFCRSDLQLCLACHGSRAVINSLSAVVRSLPAVLPVHCCVSVVSRAARFPAAELCFQCCCAWRVAQCFVLLYWAIAVTLCAAYLLPCNDVHVSAVHAAQCSSCTLPHDILPSVIFINKYQC